jgi:hypothetical protein
MSLAPGSFYQAAMPAASETLSIHFSRRSPQSCEIIREHIEQSRSAIARSFRLLAGHFATFRG